MDLDLPCGFYNYWRGEVIWRVGDAACGLITPTPALHSSTWWHPLPSRSNLFSFYLLPILHFFPVSFKRKGELLVKTVIDTSC